MRRGAWILVAAACATVLGILIVSHAGSAQRDAKSTAPVPPIYDPYPPGILPDDLVSEIERVRREVNSTFEETLREWRALPPPTVTGQPPTLQGTGYQAVQILGKLLNFDDDMSPFKNRACGFCHMPYAGF